jgi:hypothetical protein
MAPFNGGNEGELMRLFFSLPVERRGDRGGGVRPAAAAPCTPGVGAGGGRRRAWAGLGRPKGQGRGGGGAGRLGRERLPGRKVGRAES